MEVLLYVTQVEVVVELAFMCVPGAVHTVDADFFARMILSCGHNNLRIICCHALYGVKRKK